MKPNTPIRPRSRFLLSLLITVLWSAACQPEATPPAATPAPTATVLTVRIAGELALLRPVLAACAERSPAVGLLVFESDPPALPAAPDELTLWLGEPPDAEVEAALLGFDEIVVAAPVESRLSELSGAETLALFSGGPPAGSGIEAVWLPQPGQAARAVLDGFMEGAGYPPEAFLAPTAAAMVEALSGDPAAAGVLPAAWLTEDLKTLFTLGELPALALTDGVPQGVMRELIGCLQLNPVYE